MSHRQGELPALSTRHLTGRLRRGTGETSDNGRAAEKGGQPKRRGIGRAREEHWGQGDSTCCGGAQYRQQGEAAWQRGKVIETSSKLLHLMGQ